MSVSDIYHKIGQSIVDSIDEEWEKAILNIEYIGSVGFNLNYYSSSKNRKSCQLVDGFQNMRHIKELHQITTKNNKNKWNRAIFTLTPDGEFDMEFIWDQELQDEVESFGEE